jgi:hypothetical protein
MNVEEQLKSYFKGRELPESLQVSGAILITDVSLFVSLHLERMEYGCPLLQRLAISNLTALRNRLSPSEQSGAAASSQHESYTEPNSDDREVHAGDPAGA